MPACGHDFISFAFYIFHFDLLSRRAPRKSPPSIKGRNCRFFAKKPANPARPNRATPGLKGNRKSFPCHRLLPLKRCTFFAKRRPWASLVKPIAWGERPRSPDPSRAGTHDLLRKASRLKRIAFAPFVISDRSQRQNGETSSRCGRNRCQPEQHHILSWPPTSGLPLRG